MSQEQDQEKLLNAGVQAFHNTLNGALNLASLHKPKTIIEVKTAKDDLHNTKMSLKEGMNISQIKENLKNSPVAKQISQTGGEISRYVNSIVRKANMENELAAHPNANREKTQDRAFDHEQQR